VRIKEGRLGGDTLRRSPEFEDCRALAREHAVPVLSVYEAALAAAVRGEFADA
jgi:pyridinium-3,5-bisthiocarboxylic acid mononucleotide nickel chelatase